MKFTMKLYYRTVCTFAAGVLGLSISTAAQAADPDAEIATAEQHAEFAVSADDLAGVHMHLHHVINCLVGPEGEGFDANELNPCQDLGDGALSDIGAGDDRRPALENALDSALTGIGTSEDDAAKKAAGETYDYLIEAM